MCHFVGFVIMLPTAFCFGEVVSFTEENMGFVDRSDLHTPLYLFINLFAGEEWGDGIIVDCSVVCCVFCNVSRLLNVITQNEIRQTKNEKKR